MSSTGAARKLSQMLQDLEDIYFSFLNNIKLRAWDDALEDINELKDLLDAIQDFLEKVSDNDD